MKVYGFSRRFLNGSWHTPLVILCGTTGTRSIPWSFAYAPLGQKFKRVSIPVFLRFLRHSLYERVNDCSRNGMETRIRLLAPVIGQEKSYKERNLTNCGLLLQVCSPTVGKKTEMWRYGLMMLASTVDQPRYWGIRPKRWRATQKTPLSISGAMAGPHGVTVQTRKVPLPQDILLASTRKLS